MAEPKNVNLIMPQIPTSLEVESDVRQYYVELERLLTEQWIRLAALEEIEIAGDVDDNNSYDASVDGVLGIGGVFTGTATDITNCGIVFVNTVSDVASATDGLSIQQSSNGTNWDHTDDYTVAAGAAKNFSLNPHAKFFRIVYTNGGTEQASFRLQTICKGNSKPSSHRIKDNIIGDDDCELMKAAITGVNGDGTWHNIRSTPDGDLTISDNSSGLSIAEGNVTGKTFVHKFGEAPDFDETDGEVTMWDGANDSLLGGGAMAYTFSPDDTADIGLVSSSDAGDTQTIEIQGLDVNYNLVVQTITLNGQTDVDISATGVDLVRVFRLKNTGSTDIAGVVYIRTNGSGQASGVPSTANTVRALINNGNNQTLMVVYTVPNGKTGYMRSWYAATAGAKKDSEYKVKIKARPFGGVFQVKHSSAISDRGTSKDNHPYVEPEVFAAKTDIIMTTEMLKSAGVDADLSGGFDIVLVDD